MKKPQPPEEAYKSFEHFVVFHKAILTNGDYVCIHCKGYGLVYDPNDPPCIIEGNKLRDKIKCPLCSGSKVGYKYQWVEAFEKYLEEYRKQIESYKKSLSIYESILSKLTEEEINYVRKF